VGAARHEEGKGTVGHWGLQFRKGEGRNASTENGIGTHGLNSTNRSLERKKEIGTGKGRAEEGKK